MIHQIGFSGPVDLVGTSQLYKLGSLRQELDSSSFPQVWRYVYNGSGGAFAAGDVLAYAAGDTTRGNARKAPASSHPKAVLGVAQHAIANGSYGWVLCKGYGTVTADGSTAVTANTGLVVGTATAGTVQSAAAVTDAGIGFGPAAISTGASGSAYIDCM